MIKQVKTWEAYKENWHDAKEAIVEVWQEYHVGSFCSAVLTIVIMVPVMLVGCTLGLYPGGEHE